MIPKKLPKGWRGGARKGGSVSERFSDQGPTPREIVQSKGRRRATSLNFSQIPDTAPKGEG